MFVIGDFLVNEYSWMLFTLLHIVDTEWLIQDASSWEHSAGFKSLQSFVKNVLVTNDLAERGVKLMADFIDKAENEKERQELLQVVEFHRKQFPDFKKKTLRKLTC